MRLWQWVQRRRNEEPEERPMTLDEAQQRVVTLETRLAVIDAQRVNIARLDRDNHDARDR